MGQETIDRQAGASCHDLWNVEPSFRMTEPELKARPVLDRTRDSIEAHLGALFVTLAIARHLQNPTGPSSRQLTDLNRNCTQESRP